jgi:NADH-quinone oxidoreductase subunit A
MMQSYVPLLILFIVAAAITVGIFTLTSIIGPKNPTPEKMIPFECGSESTGGRFVKPSVKFYLTAILFVVFDIEAVLIYPWTTQFRALGWTGLATMASFLVLIVVALLYVWKKGALEWEK